MDLIYIAKAFFLGIIEGLTEFLPVSSTGHLILFGDLVSFPTDEGRVFDVVIQLGAIFAVCWIFREKIFRLALGVLRGDPVAWRFAIIVLVAFFPAALLGALFIGPIKQHLFNPTVVAVALVLGGFIILWVEKSERKPRTFEIESLNMKQAFWIGVAQCVSMIPGTSRSGATIIGGMLSGASRQAATEFSFFLAIPTMLGASAYDIIKHHQLLNSADVVAIAVGFVTAFISAMFVVKVLIRFVAKHSLVAFAWYRIALGIIIAVVIATA